MTILTKSQREDIEKRHKQFEPWPDMEMATMESSICRTVNIIHRDREALLASEQALCEQAERVQRIKPFVLADDQTFVIHYDELEQALEQDDG